MANKRKVTTVNSPKAVSSLTSPLRMEILQAFGTGDRLTVGDLAERVGKPRSSLYYHIRKLIEMGLLVEVERKLKGKKYESSFETASDRIIIQANTSTKPGREAMAKLIRSMTRQAARDFERALETHALDGTKAADVGRRQRAWLTEDDVKKVDELFTKIEAICAKRRTKGKGRLYSVTSLFVPLEPEKT